MCDRRPGWRGCRADVCPRTRDTPSSAPPGGQCLPRHWAKQWLQAFLQAQAPIFQGSRPQLHGVKPPQGEGGKVIRAGSAERETSGTPLTGSGCCRSPAAFLHSLTCYLSSGVDFSVAVGRSSCQGPQDTYGRDAGRGRGESSLPRRCRGCRWVSSSEEGSGPNLRYVWKLAGHQPRSVAGPFLLSPQCG